MAKQGLSGKVCLVTGASRGIGRGIALQLGEAGATVYITGRTLESKHGASIPGSLLDTAEEVAARGGRCIPIQLDHANDAEVVALFERITREQNGQLDILVNNAYAAVSALFENYGVPFWEQPLDVWDIVNNVGLRNHYLCSVRAARLMVPRKQGLIVNISSMGGIASTCTPAYGIGKEACDRMAVDCAQDLKKQNVTFVSLWPGAARTEHMNIAFSDNAPPSYKIKNPVSETIQLDRRQNFMADDSVQLKELMLTQSESVEFAGKGVVHLAQDPNLLKKSGYVLMTYALAEEYGFKDVDGRSPPNTRRVNYLVKFAGYPRLAAWIPSFIKIPKSLLWFFGFRFY